MANFKFNLNYFATRCRRSAFGHNSPANRARELFKPSKNMQSLRGSVFKNPGDFGFEFCFGGGQHN